jgi:hypothetical protein
MEPQPPDHEHSAPPGGPEEALRRLERRLDEASAAAERLIREAASEAARAAARGSDSRDTPPAGWQAPESGHAPESADARARGRLDAEPFLALLQSLRDLIPPELQRRLVEAIREVLLAIRALIDWYLERLERQRTSAPEVQDIPIL